jgi:CARDB
MGYSHATRVLAPLAAAALLAVPAGIALGSSHAQAATPAPSTPPKPGSTSAVVQSCHVGLAAADRYAEFSAQMAAVHSTSSMAVRFDLYGASWARTPGNGAGTGSGTGHGALGPFRHLAAPSLGAWNRSAVGVTIFDYNQTVGALPYGEFRAVVGYRWYGRNGRIIRRARRVTPVCVEPDQRPNLVAGVVTRQPAGVPKTTAYGVNVINRGLTAASAFDVSLSIDGSAVAPSQTVPGLAPGIRTVVTFTGPRCTTGQTLQVSVDPAGRVGETSKADNTRSIAC